MTWYQQPINSTNAITNSDMEQHWGIWSNLDFIPCHIWSSWFAIYFPPPPPRRLEFSPRFHCDDDDDDDDDDDVYYYYYYYKKNNNIST